MYLVLLFVAPFVAALLCAFASGRDAAATTRLAVFLSLGLFGLGLPLLHCMPELALSVPWFVLPGTSATVSFSLASDGLSAWLVQLITLLTPAALLASRDQVGERMREFSVAVFTMVGLMIGALLARDLVLFYVCFEGMLVPMVVLMALFGGSDRRGAALQFFLYTMLGSVFLLVAIWFLGWRLQTTDLAEVARTLSVELSRSEQVAVFFAFALAFTVKVPLPPFHGWQARAYAECPSGALILLAGAMAKIGIYGFLRFVLPLFPALSAEFSSVFIILGLIGVIGGALMALAATDVKKLIAHSSLSHLGLVMVGLFTFHETALHGAAVQLIAHGLSVAAIFLLIGALESRSLRRGLDDFGGVAERAPLLATLFIIAALASAALPGTANFVGEFLVLLGVFDPARWWIAAIAGLSTVLTAVYLLRLVQRWCFGPRHSDLTVLPDLSGRELLAIAPLLALSIIFGFYPKPITSQAGVVAAALAKPARQAQSNLAVTPLVEEGIHADR